jgi:cysteine desulfuration protein SufE
MTKAKDLLDSLTNLSLNERQSRMVSAFGGLTQWEDKYKLLIEIGKLLSPLADELKTEDAKVKGCQSQVWLHAKMQDGKVTFQADSDALLVRGLVAILLAVYSGMTPGEIKSDDARFLILMGFEKNLSPSRTNGLNAMLKQMKNFAIVFDYRMNQKT